MSFSLRIFETMSFLYPSFLFALSALAIPIIIHLIQLRKYKKIYFSNVNFLHSIEQQQRQTNKLKHLLILLARLLTILFLVLAFAQPYIPKDKKTVHTGKNYVSIYVDNSYSMERQGKNGSLLDEAKRKAKEIVNSFHSGDQFQLLGNEFSGNQQRWLNKENFLQRLAELKIRPESRSLSQVLNRQSSLLKEKSSDGAKGFVISDFQKSFIDNNSSTIVDTSIDWQMISLESNRNQNISIDSVWFYSPLHFPGSNENLLIKMSNHSSEDIAAMPYDVQLNKQTIGVGNVNIPAESSVIDTFIYKNKSSNWQEGKVLLKDQSLTFDNEYYFSYNIESSRNVSIINGPGASNFAYSIFNTEPFYKVSVFDEKQIDYKKLKESGVILLNELNEFSSGLLSEIEKSLKNGVVVIYIPSAKTLNNDFNKKFNLATLGTVQKTDEKINALNKNANLFQEVFVDQKNARLDLPHVKAYYPFEKNGQLAQSLISISNGQSLLNGYSLYKGYIYQFALPFNTSFSDLPKHAIVVPMLLRMGTIHHSIDQISYFIGTNTNITLSGIELNEKTKTELKNEEYAMVPEIRYVEGVAQLYLSDQIKSPGIYNLYQSELLKSKIGFNVSRKESNLQNVSLSELNELFDEKAKIWKAGEASLSGIIKEEAFGKRLWKICVILALFFIGLEIALIRFSDKLLQANKESINSK